MSPMLHAFLAQAIADAVGNTFEFGNPSEQEVYAYIQSDKPLWITDDTQMALFGLEALIRAGKNATFEQQCKELHRAYVRWYWTQMMHAYPSTIESRRQQLQLDGGLAAMELMQKVEAPGATCLNSCLELSRNPPGYIPSNDSKGCGSVMRILPFLYAGENGRKLALHSAALTHDHPENAFAVNKLFDVYQFSQDNSQLAGGSLPHEYRMQMVDYDDITQIGEGWTALECVDMAMWAVYNCQYDDIGTIMENMMIKAICHPGDSDSVAAIAGSIYGVQGGPIPQHLLARLEHLKLITELANQYERMLVE